MDPGQQIGGVVQVPVMQRQRGERNALDPRLGRDPADAGERRRKPWIPKLLAERRGAGGLAGRSGGVVYVLTGGLAVLVALGVVYALAVHSVASRKTDLASVTRQVAIVTAESQALQPYVQVAGVTTEKVHEVTSLAESRFNWPSAMQQLALALPGDVTFTSFTATANGSAPASATAPTTTTPTAGAGGASGSGAGFSLIGCASTQREIAEVVTNLFQVPGVSDVQLVNTAESGPPEKLSRQGAQTAAFSSGGGCPRKGASRSSGGHQGTPSAA